MPSKLVAFATAIVLAAFGVPAQTPHHATRTPLTPPNIRPGDTLARVEALIGKAEFQGSSAQNLRSFNWHKTPMMILVLVDQQGRVVSVMFQLKKKPFVSDDGVVIGRDTLRAAAAKVGKRLLQKSEVGYVADAACFGANITAKSKQSADWVVTYESLECDQGEMSVEKLPRSPINNVTIGEKGAPRF